MKGIADFTRLRIMGLLTRMNRELCVCQIEAALSESQYKISRHLKILKNTGWLKERRDGRWIYYSLVENKDPMLIKVAESYEGNVRTAVRRFVSLLEPMILLIMGGVVGFIVLSILLAVTSITEIPF